jgi:hypothetical protein
MVPCLLAGSLSAQEDFDITWPVETKLMAKDWVVDEPNVFVDVGDVYFVNSHEDFQIRVVPYDAYKIEAVNIHVVQDVEDFAAVLDNKGKPKAGQFDYKTDYGTPADHHLEVIPLENFEICWGHNPEACPPLLTIVHVELQGVPEAAYAENGGVFDRYGWEEEWVWGWYVTYPPAKPEAGHFFDAVVNGLSYATISQHGMTGQNGQFWYIPGEDIGFSVGSLFIGDALADRRVGPPDLFDGADMDDDRVANVARLLQSFDADGKPRLGAININEEVVACLETALTGLPPVPMPDVFFADDAFVTAVIDATIAACAGQVELTAVTKEEALENLNAGMQAGNMMRRNISKTPGLASDKAKIEIMPVYVPAQRPDGTPVEVVYYDADGEVMETRDVAKPIVVTYLDEIEGAGEGGFDVFVAISRDDGDSWKRRNISKTADKSSLLGYPGKSWKPMLKVKDNKIFVAWTDKYCRGGRPAYAIKVCPDITGDGLPDPCDICRETHEGEICKPDYQGDDVYWRDDIFGVGGPQRSVVYEDFPEKGEVPYSCVWTARAVVEENGNIQWFKPEKVSSGRRDAYQIFAGAGTGVAFAIVWQEDPKGLRPGEGEGPGEGWSGARSNNKTDIWYSYITLSDFGKIDYDYPTNGHGPEDDVVDTDSELKGRVKALVPMSLPVRLSDNDVCSAENIDPDGGQGDHDFDGEGQGTHRYCGTLEGIGTVDAPGSNPLCAYTLEKTNPKGEVHNVCVTGDGRFLDGNTGASRANVFLQPYCKKKDANGECILKSAWAIVGYEESKGVGIPPVHDDDDHDCDTDDDDEHGSKYKPDEGKNVIYHSFDFANPAVIGSGGIINLPETDEEGNPVYVVDEFGELLLDWKGEPQLAYENARRVRFVTQPKSKKGPSGTVLVALYRQGEEGKGKPADIFMRRIKASPTGNPYAFGNFQPGAQNVSSVEPTQWWQNPFDPDKPAKMLRWAWSEANLADKSGKWPHLDAKAQRGALNGDDLLIGFSWTPNWGRKANDKYDFYIRRSFNGGQSWTTDPGDSESIEHNVVFRVPIEDHDTQTVTWDDEVVTTLYEPGALEPPRNVSNLRNNRVSVLEPRLVKTPGTIKDALGNPTGYPEDIWDKTVYQLAFGVEFNQNSLPDDVPFPKMPLDIFYSRTRDKGQRYESVLITPQGGNGKPEEGWNPLAKDKPEQGAPQLRQTPDGSRMYGIWLEEGEQGSDIMFRRVDYR